MAIKPPMKIDPMTGRPTDVVPISKRISGRPSDVSHITIDDLAHQPLDGWAADRRLFFQTLIDLNWSQAEFARRYGLRAETVTRWRNAEYSVPIWAVTAVRRELESRSTLTKIQADLQKLEALIAAQSD